MALKSSNTAPTKFPSERTIIVSETQPREPRREDFQPSGRNPFGQEIATRPVGALANAEQQRSIAEVQARMIIARANPRDALKAMDLILRDCTRPTLAMGALYQYARGGSSVTGPSIRLAEAIAQRWGNIASGIKEVARSGGYSECVAYAWDLESGYYDERQFQVRHWRDTKGGGYALTDERDIYELIANMGQRRKRAVMLTVIPGDVVEAAVEQCESTLTTSADTSPEALARIAAAFEQFGVSRTQIEKRCQCRLEAIRPAQVVQLRKIYASLKDGMSEAVDWFEAPNGAWAANEEMHAANAAPSQTQARTAPRKAAAKKGAAAAPQEDGIPFDKWDGEQTAPVVATEAQAAGESLLPSAPPAADPVPTETHTSVAAPTPEDRSTQPPTSGGQAFSAWLLDADGTELADEDGVIPTEPFTDPVAFARAYVDVRGNLFPADIEAFEAVNKPGIVAAMIASTAVAPLLIIPEPSAPAPAEPTLPMEMPIDPAFIALPTPIKLTKATMAQFNDELKARAAAMTTLDGIDHLKQVNEPTFGTFPPSGNLAAQAIIETRRKELTPAPTGTMAETMEQLAVDMIKDVYSLTTADSCDMWEAMPAIKAKLLDLGTNDPERHTQVLAALKSARLLMKTKACTTNAQAKALNTDVALLADMKWLHANAPLVHSNTSAEMKAHVAKLTT